MWYQQSPVVPGHNNRRTNDVSPKELKHVYLPLEEDLQCQFGSPELCTGVHLWYRIGLLIDNQHKCSH